MLARPLIYVAVLSVARPTGCALHGASLFLVWPRKSNQKEGHPCIRVLLRKTSLAPVLLRGSSRRDIHVPLRLSRHPCLEPPCATPALGLLKGIKDRVAWGLVGWKTAKHFPPQSARPSKLARQDRWVSFALPTLRRSHTDDLLHGPADATESPLSEGRTESAWRGASGMDAARGVKGHGWPLYAGPRNVDGVREVSRSETRMQGQAFLLTFFGAGRPATEKSESPCKAKPVARAEESVAPYIVACAPTGGKCFAVFHSTKAEKSESQPENAASYATARAGKASRASSLLQVGRTAIALISPPRTAEYW
ncbi:MAG TPA: hypothetical protein DCQ80_07710 [Pseudomonas sp.]|nr:hypothetical protein [Pseudomonas sp.]